jgi:hypothetical protein
MIEEDIEKDLTVQILGGAEISELDFETREALPGWNQEDAECVYCKREIRLDEHEDIFYGYKTAGGEWVSIKRMEELLEEFKAKGATHLAMEHHCDHNGYVFDYGVLRVSTPEDIAKQNLAEEKFKKANETERIKELEKELKSLKGE